MLSRIKFDIDNLVTEILDALPISIWASTTTTFLDPAIGGGQFVRSIEQRLRDYGHSEANIRSRVFGFEESNLHINYAVNKYKLVGQYTKMSYDKFLKMDNTMKFDVVVGNPPYQRADNKAKRWTLWEEFVNASLDSASIVAMIVPQSLTSPGPVWNRIKKHVSAINIDIKQHFNVGSTFCYFLVDQSQEVETTIITTATEEIKLDVRNLPFLPSEINNKSLELLKTLTARPKRIWTRGELHTSNSEKFDEAGAYTVMHTNAQTLHSNFEHPNLRKIRVAVTLSGYPKFQVLQNSYCSQACFWTEFETLDAATAFADECNGATIQEIVGLFKWSGWNSKHVISML